MFLKKIFHRKENKPVTENLDPKQTDILPKKRADRQQKKVQPKPQEKSTEVKHTRLLTAEGWKRSSAS